MLSLWNFTTGFKEREKHHWSDRVEHSLELQPTQNHFWSHIKLILCLHKAALLRKKKSYNQFWHSAIWNSRQHEIGTETSTSQFLNSCANHCAASNARKCQTSFLLHLSDQNKLGQKLSFVQSNFPSRSKSDPTGWSVWTGLRWVGGLTCR